MSRQFCLWVVACTNSLNISNVLHKVQGLPEASRIDAARSSIENCTISCYCSNLPYKVANISEQLRTFFREEQPVIAMHAQPHCGLIG